MPSIFNITLWPITFFQKLLHVVSNEVLRYILFCTLKLLRLLKVRTHLIMPTQFLQKFVPITFNMDHQRCLKLCDALCGTLIDTS